MPAGAAARISRLFEVAVEIALRRQAKRLEVYDLALAVDRWAIPQDFITTNSSVVSIDAPDIPWPPNHSHPSIQRSIATATAMLTSIPLNNPTIYRAKYDAEHQDRPANKLGPRSG